MNSCDPKDPAIKLFGKTIPVPESHFPAWSQQKSDVGFQIPYKSKAMDVCREIVKHEPNDAHLEESANQAKSSVANNGNEEENQITGDKIVKPKEEPAETSSIDTEKILKKPDKILACPRCSSFDTKFCYFNNYNVNQPRHFCKNCHRYWTAGGTVRNVPVGAGRRKNKPLGSQYQQIFSRGESRTNLRPSNGEVIKFGTEMRLCHSTETMRVQDEKGYAEDLSSATEREDENQVPQEVNEQGTRSNPLQCYPVPPCVFAWNQVLNSGSGDGKPNTIQWCPTPMVAIPGFSTSSIPLQFVPASYWSYFPVWTEGTRHSPTLGKHLRDGNLIDEEKSEKCVLIPKTARIDDPDEGSTLGLNSNQKDTGTRCSVFRPYKSSPECKSQSPDTTEVLEANPAALSRSHTFRESTSV